MASTGAPPFNVPTGVLLVQHCARPFRFAAAGLIQGSIVWESYYSGTQAHYQ